MNVKDAIHRTAAIIASNAVTKAINEGTLPRLSKTRVKCSDCPKRATVYDHRDYNLPLEVEPVCHSCNAKRGKARFIAPLGFRAKTFVPEVTMKVGEKEYNLARAFAKKRGQKLGFTVSEALRKYVEANRNHDQA